jgi:membrane associated rhomboid family serine protease
MFFPYSDNLWRETGLGGVVWLIIGMSALNLVTFTNSDIEQWALLQLSFVPLLFSLHPWANLHRLVSSVFLHNDIFHLLGNCLFLWVFGRSLERLFGFKLFMVVFPFLGAVGLLVHWGLNPDSTTPVIGASGAIATLMGAYLVLFPKARMKTIVFLGIAYKRVRLPAWTFLFYWSGLQLFSVAIGSGEGDNVAYAVHVGGFMLGVLGAMIWKVSYPFAEERLEEFTASAFQS